MKDIRIDLKLYYKLEFVLIIIVLLLFVFLLFISQRNQTKDIITKNIQSEINKEYTNIESLGHEFIYFNDELLLWTDNDVPLPIIYSNILDNSLVKLPNGFYLIKNKKVGDSITIYMSLLKKEYSINNNYLSDSFNPRFNLNGKEAIKISFEKTNYNLIIDNKVLVYLDFSDYCPESNTFISYILSLLYFIIIFFIAKYISVLLVKKLRINNIVKTILLFITYSFVYITLHYIQLSYLFYNSDFFSLINITSLPINSIGEILIVQIFLFLFVKTIKISPIGSKLKYSYILLLIPAFWIYLYFIRFLLQSYDNIVSLADIIKFNIPILILISQLILGSYTLYLFIRRIFSELCGDRRLVKLDYILLSILLLGLSLYLYDSLSNPQIFILVSSLYILLIVISSEIRVKNKSSSVLFVIIVIILFSIFNGVMIYSQNYKKERIYTEEALRTISRDDDKGAEILLLEIEDSILNDSILESKLIIETNEDLEQYITNTYLRDLNKTYSTEILICYNDDMLLVHSKENSIMAKDYIGSRLSKSLNVGKSKSIFRENKGLTEKVYLVYFETKKPKRTKVILIDCIKKKASKEMGYPDLLINQEAKEDVLRTDLSNYGVYRNKRLVLQIGNFNYPPLLDKEFNTWYSSDGFSHYLIKNEKSNTVWVGSIKEQTLSDILSLPSYLFLISSIVLLFFQIIIKPKRFLLIKNITLSNSLQTTLIGVFLVSFIVFGTMSVKYFLRLTDNTNKDILMEKTQSISYSLESYFENENLESDDLYYELVELSNIFLTDINIFDRDGFLLNTSRPKVFSEGIISRLMNPDVFFQFNNGSVPMVSQEERIGNRDYTASYMPIETEDGMLGYLHVPYIIQQKKIEDKVLEFVSAYINVYILWITLALILSILLSNFITRPLRQLQERLKDIKLNQRNEKIKWSRQDELGNLIMSYNSMVDQLEESIKLLKKEEREGAWREMARQVAHDIKNPLTPMKLSIQQLQRLQNADIVKFHERFQDLSPALIEQINTLSQIASEFSDYSKDNRGLNDITDISECIKSVVEVFEGQENTRIYFYNENESNILVIGDKQQYIRVFNNLIKNSLQSLYGKDQGVIEIMLRQEDNLCKISIKDNGYGIPKENQPKIFSSEFTTKLDGSGLGLSIVKGIIEIVGGRIDFVSEEGKGSIFHISLPIWKP